MGNHNNSKRFRKTRSLNGGGGRFSKPKSKSPKKPSTGAPPTKIKAHLFNNEHDPPQYIQSQAEKRREARKKMKHGGKRKTKRNKKTRKTKRNKKTRKTKRNKKTRKTHRK